MNHSRRMHLLKLAALASCARSAQRSYASPKKIMDESTFWSLVERSKAQAGPDFNQRPVTLQKLLRDLSLSEIQAFQRRYESYLLLANQWELWGAAYLMNGGSSDDGFKYFRDWLISEGQSTFRDALANPDSLAKVPRRGDYFELEAFGYAALKAFASMGGGELDRDFNVELAAPTGKDWKEADLPALLPELANRFLRR
jgi:hypothetical protein